MEIIQTIEALKPLLSKERKQGKTVGFVPTMGALHNGHLSLVERCRKENDLCAASIFVNPTQFNDKNDLKTYPRTLEKDCEMLKPLGCDCIFAPSEKEMYPESDTRIFNFGAVAEVMEGRKRPGHFNGVAQIVSKLFDAVAPDNVYFGEKDFQQIAVIREMVRQLNLPVNIIACPIVREEDGLAMSSRNTRLTPGQREIAPAIARTLKESCTFAAVKSVKEVKDLVINTLNRIPPLRVDYFEIIDGNTLQPIEDWNETGNPVGCIAVYCDDVRLIDNIKYERLK
ncbi:MAG: pantoate--beta-alanine ligase [Tannerella sp.]|jgi:pantoate--beta-alanine ligase|nr:pantoate--beta-alanine ligase [Tannerella sp.]